MLHCIVRLTLRSALLPVGLPLVPLALSRRNSSHLPSTLCTAKLIGIAKVIIRAVLPLATLLSLQPMPWPPFLLLWELSSPEVPTIIAIVIPKYSSLRLLHVADLRLPILTKM